MNIECQVSIVSAGQSGTLKRVCIPALRLSLFGDGHEHFNLNSLYICVLTCLGFIICAGILGFPCEF